MTPQEEQALVQIIVQCVRAVLDAANEPAPATRNEASTHRAMPGSRFIDIVPQRALMQNGRQDGHPRELANKDRDDVRKSLRRFLSDSEPPVPAPTQETGLPQSLRRFLSDSEPRVPASMQETGFPQPAKPQQAVKRQLITQEDILTAHRQGVKVITLQPDAIVTPLARQVAKEKGILLR